MNRYDRDMLRMVEEIGIKGANIVSKNRSRHDRLEFDHEGYHYSIPMPGTPSDWRALKNFRSDLKKLIRERTHETNALR